LTGKPEKSRCLAVLFIAKEDVLYTKNRLKESVPKSKPCIYIEPDHSPHY